ncbi:hypothetical protein [Maribacter aquivivus]|uniref:hypothetical protein n=1 Tax=Maribacter aquivivus TaxID=228958 RepID=UPI00248F9A53|nr:hypothetical protein [Maribacter aquivivus]
MKNLLLIFTFISIICCKEKEKKTTSIKTIQETKTEPLFEENYDYEEAEKENTEKLDSIYTEKNNSLTISYNEYQIELITKNENSDFFDKPFIRNDSIYIIGPDISDLESIRIKDLNPENVKISQMFQSNLVLQFDGKAFALENWKEYQSDWFDISYGKEIKIYSENDYEKFPKYNRQELLKAIEINRKNISEHWYSFVMKNLDNDKSEMFFHPIINETIFKIEIEGQQKCYIVLEHFIGC